MSNTLEVTPTSIRVPKGSGEMIEFDLSEIRTLEARKDETAFVSVQKAQELLAAMEKGHTCITKLLPSINYEIHLVNQAIEDRKAVVFLDEAPEILKKKGLTKANNPAGTADQRACILALDAEYKRLDTILAQLKAVKELLVGKARGFEMCFQTIKLSVKDSTYGYSGSRVSVVMPDLADNVSAGDEVTSYGTLKVGTPRY